MSAAAGESKRAWALAILGALAAVFIVMALFRAPSAPPPPPPRMKPSVELHVAGNALFNDRAAFNDPRPLFLPTPWNNAPPEHERREPQGRFRDYDPKFAFVENDLQLNLPASISAPARPADALAADPPGNPLVGIGRTDAAIAALPPRWAFVEVIAAGTGRRVLARALADGAAPDEAPAPLREGLWQPLEFMAAVDASGLVGQLMPVASQEIAAADPFLQLEGEPLAALENYLAQKLRVGDRLPPGFYRICVGP